jgi:pilus assembly protein Flp/PilA
VNFVQELEFKMLRMSRRFFADESAATAIEYSLIATGVAGAIVAVVASLGQNVNSMWASVSTALR